MGADFEIGGLYGHYRYAVHAASTLGRDQRVDAAARLEARYDALTWLETDLA